MARPIKHGLDYFPLDIDIDLDDKIAIIEALYGIEGFGIVIKLLMKIYKEGYYYEWNLREQRLFSKRANVEISLVNDVVKDCLNEGLFNNNIYKDFNVLTSRGIQKRYLEAIKRRKEVEFISEFFLITDEVTNIIGNNNINISYINVNINLVNVNIGTQRKGKESIGKENKGKESINDDIIVVPDSIDYESIITYFHSVCISLPKVKSLTDARKKNIKKRISEHGKDKLAEVFNKTESSDFLSGKKTDWKSSFDWIIKKENFIKILEGNYDNKQKERTTRNMTGLDDVEVGF